MKTKLEQLTTCICGSSRIDRENNVGWDVWPGGEEMPTAGTYRRGCWCGENEEHCHCFDDDNDDKDEVAK